MGTFFQNGGQWYYQNDECIWKVNEGVGKRFSLVVRLFHRFSQTVTEAHGGDKEPPKKSTKD